MNPEKFTRKKIEALAGARELAVEAGHAQYTPIHLVMALISEPSGILRQAITTAGGGEEAANSFERVLRQDMKIIPSQHPTSYHVHANTSMDKVVRRAKSLQKSIGDTC